MGPVLLFVLVLLLVVVLMFINVPSTLRNSVVIERPARIVFNFLSDPENLPEWNPRVKYVNVLTEGRIEEGSRWEMGIGSAFQTHELVFFEPPTLFITRMQSNRMSSQVEYRLTPEGNTTFLDVTAQAQVPLIRALALRLVEASNAAADLARLKALMEEE